eukprot:7385319-Prymnesium_polylepis.1
MQCPRIVHNDDTVATGTCGWPTDSCGPPDVRLAILGDEHLQSSAIREADVGEGDEGCGGGRALERYKACNKLVTRP